MVEGNFDWSFVRVEAGHRNAITRLHRAQVRPDVRGTEGSDAYNRCLTNQAIDRMVALIGAVYEAVSKDKGIAVDRHWRYTVSDVVKLARQLEPFRLLWLEDPVPPANREALKAVTSRVRFRLPLERTYFFLRDSVNSAGTRTGDRDPGFAEGRRPVHRTSHRGICRRRNHSCGPHNISSPVGTWLRRIFVLRFRFLVLELNDLVEGVPKPIIQKGFVRVPDKPGLGVKLNEEVARRYARQGEPFFD